MNDRTRPEPPSHLSESSQDWFKSVIETWSLEKHHILLLTAACELLDRAETARLAVLKDGEYIHDHRGSLVRHPGVNVQRDSLIGYSRLLRELDLDVSIPKESRPPQLRSMRSVR